MHEIFSENLRNPARSSRADLMRQFRTPRTGQVYSIDQVYRAEGSCLWVVDRTTI
jgi:hypothetical protein